MSETFSASNGPSLADQRQETIERLQKELAEWQRLHASMTITAGNADIRATSAEAKLREIAELCADHDEQGQSRAEFLEDKVAAILRIAALSTPSPDGGE